MQKNGNKMQSLYILNAFCSTTFHLLKLRNIVSNNLLKFCENFIKTFIKTESSNLALFARKDFGKKKKKARIALNIFF